MRTVTTSKRGEFALVTPYLATVTHTKSGDSVHAVDAPLRTVTTAKGGEFVLVSPTLTQTGYGERDGQAPRVPGLDKPLGTVVAGGQKHALVTAFLAKHFTQPEGRVHAGIPLDVPTGTATARDHHSLVTAYVAPFYGRSTGASAEAPLPTATGHAHLAEVRAFLVKYYGADGEVESQQQNLFGPLHTVTTKARFGLVTVHGQQYQIADIGMRMLAPHELFAAQGFPPDYVLDPLLDGKPLTKTQQIELAGNSVCPPAAYALVAANARTLRRAA